MLIDGFQIQVHTSTRQLSDDWPEADDRTGCAFFVFQSRAFLEAWEASYGRKSSVRLCLVEVRQRDGAPIIFLPLYLGRRYGVRVLSFIDGGVSDYNAPVIFPGAAQLSQVTVAALLERVLSAVPPHDIVVFTKLPEQVETCSNPLWQFTTRSSAASTHAISLTRPLDEIEGSIQSIRNIRKRDRALQRMGELRFFLAGAEPEQKDVLTTMLRQKQRRFEETMVPGFDAHPEKQNFFEEATKRLTETGALHFSALALNGTILATMWSLVRKDRYCAMITTFEDGLWGRYSPGKVLMLHLLRALKADGYASLDLGFGDEPWKRELCDRTMELRDYIRVVTHRGRVALHLEKGLASLRASPLYRKLRPLKWRLLRGLR